MNTNPNDTTLALWLDDELHGDALASVEAWALARPAQLAAREDIRRWRSMIHSAIPASEEPPAAEFFNARILKTITDETLTRVEKKKTASPWMQLLMPAAACICFTTSFWLGTHTQPDIPSMTIVSAPKAIPVMPAIYAPEQGVAAEWFTSNKASATIILLKGVDAIPDNLDFSASASIDQKKTFDSTAAISAPDLATP